MRILYFLLTIFSVLSVRAYNYRGIIKDSETGLPIENATIRFFDQDSVMLVGAISKKDGSFVAITEKMATRVLITYVGYKTYSAKDSLGFSQDIGTVLMQQDARLDEIVITSNLISKDADKISIFVTDSLRKGVVNTSQMLDKISGIKADWITGTLKVGHEDNVLIIVNGKERGNDYALNLNPERIKNIEISRNPTGRFSGYSTVVNLELKENYKGWDISSTGIGVFSLDHGFTNQENINTDFTYTFNKWSIYGNVGYKRKKIHDLYFFEKQYGESYSEKSDIPNLDSPNKLLRQDLGTFSLGIDYNINKNQTLSVQTWVDLTDSRDSVGYMTHIWQQNKQDFLHQESENNYKSDNYSIGLFYRGYFFDRLNIVSDLTYNYYNVKEYRSFTQGDDYVSLNNYHGYKDHIRYSFDSDYKISDILNASLNYSFSYRHYDNKKLITGESVYYSDNIRNTIEVNLSYHPSDKFQIRGGSSVLFVNDRNTGEGMRNNAVMPYFRLYWKPIKIMDFSLNYHCSVTHPNLDQLSTAGWQVDSYMRHLGNPNLKPTIMNYAEAVLEFKNLFTITYMWKVLKNDISSWYSKSNGQYYIESLQNSDFQHSYISLLGDYTIGKYWKYYIHLAYQRYKRHLDAGLRRYGNVYSIDTNLAYHVAPIGLNIMAAYYLRYDKSPLLQGFQYTEEESLNFGLNRNFCDGKLPVTFMLQIPTNAISKLRYTTIDIDGYKSAQYSDDRINNFALMFRVQYKFGGGKSTRKNFNEVMIDKEK